MANFIEELFYNNINPQARMVRNGSNLQKQLGLLSDYEEQLTSNLKDDERKLYYLTMAKVAFLYYRQAKEKSFDESVS